MVNESETAKRLAELLLQIKAIELRPDAPFTWASGILSPIYCDNRVTLSHPMVRTYLREQMAQSIKAQYPTVEVIAGVATGAIALAALVAQELNLPMIYVRSAAKGHGRQNLIEGHLPKGARVVVIEDLVSTGMSSLQAVDALREAEAHVLGMGAIFTYGFQQSVDAFAEKECPLFTLSDYDHLLGVAEARNTLHREEAEALAVWRKDPAGWGASR
ncbi:MAG: orotate phosphoribosyltransferase [Schleiferiaceae bacterium]|nr:orotate phosphoribosyltransferase [Flavobacteriia bacterium]NDA06586.1 orotate phosphoribosyltransferase [Flavobacteriia bacterium]NDA27854.1 orotate phosphoribosyltransferase [Flavobacteriia bacterium]NDD18978.1 orotate phosphoribosyltransferase [Flavobacteriia bacterium]NDD80312.1 orotate phosphoribosyltransferase [Flavobacteriia bacterium]